jgi:hypothetical protein
MSEHQRGENSQATTEGEGVERARQSASREIFEKEFAKKYGGGMVLGRNLADDYTSPYTQTAWDAWQACVKWMRTWID